MVLSLVVDAVVVLVLKRRAGSLPRFQNFDSDWWKKKRFFP
jgi:hypothetical protein